jgi:O-antigen/teichoic acid export membrane protein
MENSQKIAANTAWQILGKIIGTVFGILTIGLLTRYLGQEDFGHYTTAVAFMQFFGVLVDMGLYLICLKEISAHPEKEDYIISNIFTLRVISAFIFIGGGIILIFAFPYPLVIKLSGAIVAISFFFMSLVQTLTTVFQKYLKMGSVALAEILGRAGFLGVIILFILFKNNLPYLMWGNVANTFIYFIILWFLVKRYVKITWQIDFAYWQAIFKKAWPIALGIVFNLVYFRADTIILSLFKPAGDVGIYGAPYKILEIIATFPHMFMGLVMPLLTAAWITNQLDKFKDATQKTFDFFVILALPMILGTLPLARQIMILIAGENFAASGKVLAILILATGIIFLGVLLTYLLVILEKQRAMLKYFFTAAVLALTGYLIFIPRYSYFGAAWVTVGVELFIVITSWLIFYQTTKVKINFQIFFKSLLAAGLMSLIIYLLPAWHVLILIGLAILIYFALMLIIGGIDKKFLSSIFNQK